MSDWCNYRIKLNSSSHYRYLLCLLNGGAALTLLNSGLAWWLIISLLTGLLVITVVAFNTPYPAGDYRELIHQGDTWQLIGSRSNDSFDTHRILLHAGLFILVKLSCPEKQQLLVIFCDQISKTDYRRLKIIEKLK